MKGAYYTLATCHLTCLRDPGATGAPAGTSTSLNWVLDSTASADRLRPEASVDIEAKSGCNASIFSSFPGGRAP